MPGWSWRGDVDANSARFRIDARRHHIPPHAATQTRGKQKLVIEFLEAGDRFRVLGHDGGFFAAGQTREDGAIFSAFLQGFDIGGRLRPIVFRAPSPGCGARR